jgi:chorismate dehydratase
MRISERASGPVAAAHNTAGATQPNNKLLRLGQISFINSLPVVLPLTQKAVECEAELTLAAPAVLNSLFASRTLDAGAMSTFFFLEDGGFTLIDNLSISSKGEVGSVLYFGKRPLNEAIGARIAASNLSATSVNLLKILFSHHYQFVPDVFASDNPNLEDPSVDGILLIGDAALAADRCLKTAARVDLGLWWWQTFKLPMVFGVWAADSNWVDNNAEQFAEISVALAAAKRRGLTDMLPAVLDEAQARTGLPANQLRDYFLEQLNFDLNDEHRQAITLYGKLCRQLGLLPDRLSTACAR